MEHIAGPPSGSASILAGSPNASGGTGSRFHRAVTIVAGAAALSATILTFLWVAVCRL